MKIAHCETTLLGYDIQKEHSKQAYRGKAFVSKGNLSKNIL